MNDKELRALAESVGIRFQPAGPGDDGIDTWYGDQYLPNGSLRKLVDAAVSAERERCAMAVVDYSLSSPFDENDRSLFAECAQYVRDGVLPKA